MDVDSNEKMPKKKKFIIQAAGSLFIRHGVKRITVEEICRTSGASKMTFYKYFRNKIELVKYIWHLWMEDGFDEIDAIESMDIPFPEKMHRLFQCKADLFSKMNTEFMDEILPVELDQAKFEKRCLTFIMDAQRKGEIRPHLRPELVMAAWEKLQEFSEGTHVRQKYPDSVAFEKELKDLFWFGVLTGKYASI